MLDEHTIAFADYRGNKQFITTGNLLDNPKVHLFLIDYAAKDARIAELEAELRAARQA